MAQKLQMPMAASPEQNGWAREVLLACVMHSNTPACPVIGLPFNSKA